VRCQGKGKALDERGKHLLLGTLGHVVESHLQFFAAPYPVVNHRQGGIREPHYRLLRHHLAFRVLLLEPVDHGGRVFQPTTVRGLDRWNLHDARVPVEDVHELAGGEFDALEGDFLVAHVHLDLTTVVRRS
jgi:hypothetical protein